MLIIPIILAKKGFVNSEFIYIMSSNVGLSKILDTKVRKKFNGRKPAKRTHGTIIRPSFGLRRISLMSFGLSGV